MRDRPGRSPDEPPLGIQTGLTFISITAEELRPAKLSGYGELDPRGRSLSIKAYEDLERLIDQVAAYLRQGLGRDLQGRLKRLDEARADVDILAKLEQVIARWQLVEFRPPLEMIVDRLESPRFEVALFGA